MALQYLSVDTMSLTKDLLDNPASDEWINATIDAACRLYPTINLIGISVPMNTNAEALASRGSNFAIQPATYAKKFTDAIHNHGKNVLFRGTDCYFEGIYNFPRWVGGSRYPIGSTAAVLGAGFTDDFNGPTLSGTWQTAHRTGNTWTVSNGELVAPSPDGWRRTCLNVDSFTNMTVTCLVKKVGNQQIVLRATTDPNFPGYGFQIRSDNGGEFRLERPGLAALSTVSKTFIENNWYWIKGECSGTTIRGKVWGQNDTEPASWDISITDSTYTSGFVGVSGESTGGRFKHFVFAPVADRANWNGRVYNWIVNNPDLFTVGDVFAPFPEPTGNGFFSDVTCFVSSSPSAQANLATFFITIKATAEAAFKQIGKQGVICGLTAQNWTEVASGYVPSSTMPNVVTVDHYGTATGNGKLFLDVNVDGTSSDTYTLLSAVDEGATHRQTISPANIAYNVRAQVWVVDKGTGNWTLTIHDSNNSLPVVIDPHTLQTTGTVQPVTIANASISNGAWLSFDSTWDSVWNSNYHVHITSSNGTGTAKVISGHTNDAEWLLFRSFKAAADARGMEIDLRKTSQSRGMPIFLQEWGDFWSEDAARSSPVRNQAQHEAYLDTMYAAFQRLIDDGIIIGFNYWRILGGTEAVLTDTDASSNHHYENAYDGVKLGNFLNANRTIPVIPPPVPPAAPGQQPVNSRSASPRVGLSGARSRMTFGRVNRIKRLKKKSSVFPIFRRKA